jgi:hypothetical protein
LKPRDSTTGVRFCSWFLQSVVEGEIDQQLTSFSDEAWIHLQRYINTQNNRHWRSQNPHLIHETALHPVKFGVSCALSATRIVGPVYFNETINCEIYVQVILGQFFPELTEEDRLYGWFQQDSATAHTARTSMQALSNVGVWCAESARTVGPMLFNEKVNC